MLHGRVSERAAVAALLDGARTGRGGVLVLRGVAGVGKSTLLADAVAGAQDLTLLRTQGVESESPLAFAGLQRLLRPVMHHLADVPPLQAQALRAALGETSDAVPDRFLVYLATLSLLAEAAAGPAPVLAVVDDAHWLDEASTAALLFVARRLELEHVALLFGARDADARTFEAGALPTLVLGGLDTAEADALLQASAPVPVLPAVRDALMAATDGNPLALVELTAALSPDQLSGAARLPDRLPVTEAVERAFLGRYRHLPEAARTVLLAAAADDSGRVAALVRAATELGAGDEGVQAAETSGLLTVRGEAAELRHPLVRSAVYGAATSIERRRVHRALAAALTGPEDADRRAWHLAAAATEPDEAVVAELDDAAERAHRRGGHEAAAAAWERAAELSADDTRRAARLYRAAASSWAAARPGRARALADAALTQANDPILVADLTRLRGQVEFNVGSLAAGRRRILDGAAAVAPHDPGRAAEMAMLAAALAAVGGPTDGPDPAGLVPPATPGAPARARCLVRLVPGLTAVTRGDWPRAASAIRQALDLAPELDDTADSDILLNLAVATWYVGDDATGLLLQDRLLATARSTGSVFNILHALTRRSITQIACGSWAAARAAATEAITIAESSEHRAAAVMPLAVLALLDALQGSAEATARLARAEALLELHPQGVLAGTVADLVAMSRAALDPAAAHHHLGTLQTVAARHLTAIDRIEAAVRAGRTQDARAWTAELAELAAATGAAWATASAEHARAVLGEGGAAEDHFRAALAAHDGSLRLPDRARTELAYGELLRRSRRRVDSREHLRAALTVFEELGAEPLARRARQELRASGESARRRDDTAAADDLTPQETQVADLVSRGLSNKEVAAQLFLSPRTIDFHLRNVFAKLGISSRTELVALQRA